MFPTTVYSSLNLQKMTSFLAFLLIFLIPAVALATTVPAPQFDPGYGNFYESFLVNISTSDPTLRITYNTDGNDPTLSSTIFTAPLNFSNPGRIFVKARAFNMTLFPLSYTQSVISSAEYHLICNFSFFRLSTLNTHFHFHSPSSTSDSCCIPTDVKFQSDRV